MGRDHATECPYCGTFYGGLNWPDMTECPNCPPPDTDAHRESEAERLSELHDLDNPYRTGSLRTGE